MKNSLNIQLQPASLLLGLAVGVLALVAMGQKPQNIRELVRVEYGPHPRDMVQIKENVPYVVPSGKLFVLTALGSTHAFWEVLLSVDGQREALAENGPTFEGGGLGIGSNMKLMPPGFTAKAGAKVVVQGGAEKSDNARAWGYLADA